jgi:hypothetical protein
MSYIRICLRRGMLEKGGETMLSKAMSLSGCAVPSLHQRFQEPL